MSIRIISDLHLDASRPQISRAFLHYLKKLPEEVTELYILGDFFEAWIGDDDNDAFKQSIKDALTAKTSKGLAIYFLHGNRDFLIGKQFSSETGVQLLPELHHISSGNKEYLLMHGDSLCINDIEYQAFRQKIRHPDTIAFLLSKSLDERRIMATQLREQSKEANSNKASDIMDVNTDEVTRIMTQENVNLLIHGHTHRPAIHQLPESKQRIVLGDWDKNGWEIILNHGSLSLNEFTLI